MADLPIIDQQGARSLPLVEGYSEGTNLVISPTPVHVRMRHLSEDVYDLSAESHLMRLAKVLLGDAGAGRLIVPEMLAKFQHSIQGSHFYDLDRFFGALFGTRRRLSEILSGNPYTDVHSDEEWEDIAVRDDAFRSRMEQLMAAIAYGASAAGMELAAEAILNVDCDIYESFVQSDRIVHTYEDVEGIGTYGSLHAYTYGMLEWEEGVPVYDRNRSLFTVTPKRPISPEERYDLIRVLNVLKPAHALLRVSPMGLPSMTEVKIRDASADSSYWRINQKFADGTFAHHIDPWTGETKRSLVNGKSRSVFAAYQGEAWSALASAASISAYLTDASDALVHSENHHIAGHAFIMEGGRLITVSFPSDMALMDLGTLMAGRTVSDGILVRSPYAENVRGLDTPLPVFTDQAFGEQFYLSDDTLPGSLVDLVIDAYNLKQNYSTVQAGAWGMWGVRKTTQRMWVTAPLPWTETNKEIVELRFKTPQLLNYVTAELARYPHVATFQAWDTNLGEWVSLQEWRVTESMPQRMVQGQRTEGIVHQSGLNAAHPEHSAPGHWMKVSERVQPIRTHRVRIVLQRHRPGDNTPVVPPVGTDGRPSDYTLAVRNWDVGYRITSLRDVPRIDEALGSAFAIGATVDTRGEPVIMEFHSQEPRRVIERSSGRWSVNEYSGHSWRCDANPTNRGVASLFLDLTDDDGNGQVIDGFDLEPLKSGPHINLYYANEAVYGDFEASDEVLAATVSGGVTERQDGSLRFPAGSSLGVQRREFGFALTDSSWTLGATFSLEVDTETLGSITPLLSVGGLNITVGNLGIVSWIADLAYEGWDTLRMGGGYIAVPQHTRITVLVSYDEVKKVIRTQVIADGQRAETTVTTSGQFVVGDGGINIGGTLGLRLHSLFLRQGVLDDSVVDVHNHPERYTIKARPGDRHQDFTQRSIVRFSERDPSAQSWRRFRGGIGNTYEYMVWHPIPRDFTLKRGIIKFPATKAKFWKMEFTNLAVEAVSNFVPIVRRIRLHPPSAAAPPYPAGNPANAWKGMVASLQANSQGNFRDTRLVDTNRPSSITRARYLPDVRQAAALKDVSWLYGWQEWQRGSRAPRFREVGVHRYDEFDLVDTSKLAYFVGLNRVRALRTDYLRDDDVEVIYERFSDSAMIENPNDWHIEPGVARGIEVGVPLVSRPYRSHTPLTAIQFAATQSAAKQVLPDDGFRHPSLVDYGWDDQSSWHVVGDAVARYNASEYSVSVSRDLSAVDAGVGSHISPVNVPVHPVFAIPEDEPGLVSIAGEFGGIESRSVSTSSRGMIHAAVRVTAESSITNPLVLQIVGQASGEDFVLAESEHSLVRGETAEMTLSYVLGAFDRSPVQLWDTRSIVDEPFRPILPSEGPEPTGEIPGFAPDETVRVRLIQRGSSADTWKVEKFSLFDDGFLWEFSNDGGASWVPAYNVRSNPNAVVTFPEEANSLLWRVTAFVPDLHISAIQIRPWYQGKQGTVMGTPHRGGNISSFDQTPPIQDDPEFKVWHHPVPRWWWRESERFPILPVDGQPRINPWSTITKAGGTDSAGPVTDDGHGQLLANRVGLDFLPLVDDSAVQGFSGFRVGEDDVLEG